MKDTVLKLQIESMEQQLKMLKTKIVKPKPHKKLSELYGIFKGKMDLSLEEITEHKYTGLIYKSSMAREVFILTEDDDIKSSGILPVA